MNMKLWLITGMVALIGFAPLAEGAKKKLIKKKAVREKRDKDLDKKERAQRDFEKLQAIGLAIELPTPKNTESLTDDMETLDEKVTLTDQQKKKIPEMRALRDKILTNWDKVNRKKFDAMKAGLEKLTTRRQMRLCKTIVTQLRSLARARAAIVLSNERKFFGALTPEQRGKWNTPIVSQVLLDEFSSLELSKEQIAKIELAAGAQAKRLAVPLGSGPPPTQVTAPIKKYVYTRILTTKQRKQYIVAKRQEALGEKGR